MRRVENPVMRPYRSIVQLARLPRCQQARSFCFSLVIFLFLFSLCAPARVDARPQTGLAAPIQKTRGAADGAAVWGDFDEDDDLDLLVNGLGNNLSRATLLYQNVDGDFVLYESGLPRVEAASADWGDYDNDGYLDVLITGQVGYGSGHILGLAEVYHNTTAADGQSRTFERAYQLPPVYSGAGVWGDYNNDGRLDILLTGYTDGGQPLTRIYRNDGAGTASGAAFTNAVDGLIGLGGSQARWGDYDADGFQDFVILGRAAGGEARALVYHNNQAQGFDAPISLTGMWAGEPAWIDVENDGDLDLLLTGNRGDNGANIQPTTLLYKNSGGAFTPVSGSGLPDIWDSSISVGDYDNDGYADLLLNGLTRSDRPTAIYRNNHNFTFTDAQAGLPNGTGLSVAWGDFNADRTLDAAVSGVNAGGVFQTLFYPNTNPLPPANSLPTTPVLRAACWNGQTGSSSLVTLDWATASDAQNSSGLTYSLRLGSMPWGHERVSPPANKDTGWRRAAQPGSINGQAIAIVRGLEAPGPYYWAVQAVDGSLAGGMFSTESQFWLERRVAYDDAYSMPENSNITFNVLYNDDPGFHEAIIYAHTLPRHGTIEKDNVQGRFTYTPNANWHGTDTFNYSAISEDGLCTSAVVTLTVDAVYYPPADILLSNNHVLENQPVGTRIGRFSATDPDSEDQAFTYSLVPQGSNNMDNDLFEIVGDELRTRQRLDYDPHPAVNINVQATDPHGLSVTKRFIIAVDPNTQVSIACQSGCATLTLQPKSARLSMSEDGAPTPFQLTLRADDPGALETLTWSAPVRPARGTLSFAATSLPGAALPVQYTPEANWFGADSFTLAVRDPLGNTDQIVVTVDVLPVNDPPALDALPDRIFVEWSGEHAIPLSGIDPGAPYESAQPLTLTAETDAPNLLRGLAVDYPGSGSTAVLRFRLEEGTGQAAVTVTVRDGQSENATHTQTFVVTVVNGPRVFFPVIWR